MSIFEAVVFGIVEGITEFLPISSTGHLILTGELLGIEHTDFVTSFEIAIQLGAILSVVALYWRSFLDIEVLKKLAAAFAPTAVIGFTLYPFIKDHLLGNETIVLWSLLIGGIALIAFELWHRKKAIEPEEGNSMAAITYTQALLVGCFQAVAIVPGVSRSGATIIGGLFLGLSRVTIVEFSFLLAVPTMFAATGLDLLQTSGSFASDEWLALGAGFVVSFFVAMASIVWLLKFVRTHTFIPFGIYRVLLAILFFIFIV